MLNRASPPLFRLWKAWRAPRQGLNLAAIPHSEGLPTLTTALILVPLRPTGDEAPATKRSGDNGQLVSATEVPPDALHEVVIEHHRDFLPRLRHICKLGARSHRTQLRINAGRIAGATLSILGTRAGSGGRLRRNEADHRPTIKSVC